MDKAMLWGFSVAMYVVVGLQWSRLLERADPADAGLWGDQSVLRQKTTRKLVRGSIFAVGLAVIIARHFALLR